jgi:N-acetylglucosamine-6-phosphate deacetylase
MSRQTAVFGGLALLAAAGPLGAQQPALSPNVKRYVSVDTGTVAVTNVLLIDGTGAAARPGQTVVIQQGKIAAVGPAGRVRPPAGALVIDGTGHTMIPGMVGLHDHLFYSAAGGRTVNATFTGPRLYLASGVTTIRTTGSQAPYADVNLRRNVEEGRTPGPRIHVTAPYLTGAGGGGSMAVATTPEEARRFVAYWAEEGAEWIKFYTNITRETMRAAIEEAKRRGVRTTGHLCAVTFREATELGIDDLAHGALTATDFYPGKEPDVCPANGMAVLDSTVSPSGPVAESVISTMVAHKVSMTSTLPVIEALYPHRPVTDQRSLDLMAPEVRTSYLADRAFIDSSKTWPFTEDGLKRQMAFEVAFVRAGGLMGNGVDPTGNGGALPGFGDQRGYELFREAGFTAEEAVQICTLNGARILHVEAQLGSVERGKTADLVLLKGDLTQDPSVIRQVETVFKDGIGYDPGKLIDDVRGRVGVN